MAAGGSASTSSNGRGTSGNGRSNSSGPSSSSPAGGSRGAAGGPSSSGSSSSGASRGGSSGPSSSSPAGGSRGASSGGMSGGNAGSGAGSASGEGGRGGGASSSSPAGGARGASGGGSQSSSSASRSGGQSGSSNGGDRSSSPAGGAAAASGRSGGQSGGQGSFGRSTGASPSSPAGGTAAASGRDSTTAPTSQRSTGSTTTSGKGDRVGSGGLPGGFNSDRFGGADAAKAPTTSAPTRAAGAVNARTGLASGLSPRTAQDSSMAALSAQRASGAVARAAPDPSRFGAAPTARTAQDASMVTLDAQRSIGAVAPANPDNARFGPNSPTPPASSLHTSPNYGAGYAQQARAAEDGSLSALHDYDREVVGVTKAGAGYTQVTLRDGTVETRRGNRASRNNNPGNIRQGQFANSMGAVGTDGAFAVFSSPQQGLKAMESLVFNGKSYRGKTIGGAIGVYAPPNENNTTAYAASVADAVGVPVNTPTSDLTPAQREAMIRGMTRVEGLKPHTTTTDVAGAPRGTAPALRSQSTVAGISNTSRVAAPAVSTQTGLAPTAALADLQAGLPPTTRTDGVAPALGVDPVATPTSIISSPQRTTPPPSTVPVAAPNPTRFAERYLGKPTPTQRPSTVPAPTTRPAEAPKAERPFHDKVLSGAIDVGVGMLPGIGTAAGIYGLAAPMLGMPSVGEMALSARDTNQFDVNKDANRQRYESGADREVISKAGGEAVPVAQAGVKESSVSDFESKYLRYQDNTKRPTPEQKWGTLGAPTAGYSA